jgi:hypothetical protein
LRIVAKSRSFKFRKTDHEIPAPVFSLRASATLKRRAARSACSSLRRDLQRAQKRGVVGHHGHRERHVGQRRAPRTEVVEGGEAVAVREPVELGLPRLGGLSGRR